LACALRAVLRFESDWNAARKTRNSIDEALASEKPNESMPSLLERTLMLMKLLEEYSNDPKLLRQHREMASGLMKTFERRLDAIRQRLKST
jgi:hypothetical protein